MSVDHTESVQSTAQESRRGFTLTEIAIVLGIVGLLLGAIWVAAAAVYNNLRVSHANTEVLQIAQAVRALYASTSSTGNAAADLTDGLICAKAVPSDMVLTACGGPGTMIDPWPQGRTAIYTPATGDSFTIEMTEVPQSACISLLMNVAGTSRDPGLFQATGTAAAVGAALATAAPFATTFVATPALANAGVASGFGGCNANPGGNVSVQFGFGLKT